MSFAADVKKWTQGSEARMSAVHRRSVEMLAEKMRTTRPQGGRVPHLTGNLARSLQASTSGMPSMGAPKQEWLTGQDVGVVTATLRLGQPVWMGYQANYARRQNYGFVGADSLGRVYDQQGAYFVEDAIAAWPEIVQAAAREIYSKVANK